MGGEGGGGGGGKEGGRLRGLPGLRGSFEEFVEVQLLVPKHAYLCARRDPLSPLFFLFDFGPLTQTLLDR